MKQRADEHSVQQQEGCRPENSTGKRVVLADDGILNRVREEQQYDEIERIQLRQLTLAREAKADQEKGIDDDRPNDFLENRHARVEQIVPDRVHSESG